MRDYKLYLKDILKAADKVDKYAKGLTLGKLGSNGLVTDAIVRNLEIIGEAVKNIPSSIKTKYPKVEWKKIAGLRDILAHEYFGIDFQILWDIIKHKLPEFKKDISIILKNLK